MNLIDAVVVRVYGEPYKEFFEQEWWYLDVQSKGMGGINDETFIFETREEAEKVKPGYGFLHWPHFSFDGYKPIKTE